jgi:hypothetical protein
MEQETDFIIYEGVVVPESVLLKREKRNAFESIEDLPDEELADPDELERCIYRDEWGPMLMLPKPKSSRFNPAWDWSVDVDFDAFASVDFERTQPVFDKVRYKSVITDIVEFGKKLSKTHLFEVQRCSGGPMPA